MRILVLGVSASGKTTFARKLHAKLDIPVILADSLMWEPGWKYIGDEAVVSKIQELIKKEEWIFEGYIATAARAEVFDRADIIIYLDYPGWLSAWRYIKRILQHHRKSREELPGSPDSFNFSFLKLIFLKKEVEKIELLLKTGNWDNKLFRFESPKDAKVYLDNYVGYVKY